MIGSVVHQCPRCELRFNFRTELEHHLREDHPQPASPQAAAVKVDDPVEGIAVPVAAPAQTRAESGERRAQQSRARLAGMLVTVAAVLLVAYAAVFVSIPSALVVAGAVLVLGGSYARRMRGQLRQSRR